jgi:general secretion pathway protein L
MSTLIVYLPPRPRLRAQGAAAPAAVASGDYAYVTSPDGLEVGSHGRATAALLPKASTVVAVLPDVDVSWHRIVLPKAPASKLRAALTGVLEEELLADAEAVHLALAPGAVGGQPTWVAAMERGWLRGELAPCSAPASSSIASYPWRGPTIRRSGTFRWRKASSPVRRVPPP